MSLTFRSPKRRPALLLFSVLAAILSIDHAVATPCDVTAQATDTVISGGNTVYSSNQTFAGRLIIKNGASVQFTGPLPGFPSIVTLKGDVFVCGSSTLSFVDSIIIMDMTYAHQYQFGVDGNSTLSMTSSTFANGGSHIGDINLSTNSTLVMNNVNRNTIAELVDFDAGFTIVLDKSSATVTNSFDRNSGDLEFAAFYDSSRLTVSNVQSLIVWITIRGANVGGTVYLPTTDSSGLYVPQIDSWRLDNTVISNLPYSIQLSSVANTAFGTIVFSESPTSASGVTFEGGGLAVGLALIGESNARLSNLTEGAVTNLSVSLPHRTANFMNTNIYTWNLYTVSSTVTVSGGQIGEILAYAPSVVQVTNAQLTGSGGYYTTPREDSVSTATLRFSGCTFKAARSTPVLLVAKNGGLIQVENSLFHSSSTHAWTSDGALLQVVNSTLSTIYSTSTLNGGTIWISSAATALQTQSDGSSTLAVTGDAVIYPSSSFSSYTIDYVPVQFPSQRRTLTTSETSVRNGTLYSGAAPADFPRQGVVTLTLRDSSGRTLSATSFTPTATSTFSVVFDDVHPFPVPFQPHLNAGHQRITFSNAPLGTIIEIYTVAGKLVRELPAANASGQVLWDVKNEDGENVVSDVYLYVARLGDQKKTGKLVVIR